MIGGLNPNAPYRALPDTAAGRERSDVARSSSASGASGATSGSVESVRQALATPRADIDQRSPDVIDSATIERRVEARQAADEARLERFRADELPLASARALEAFTGIAALREGADVELAGIDIRV